MFYKYLVDTLNYMQKFEYLCYLRFPLLIYKINNKYVMNNDHNIMCIIINNNLYKKLL